MKNNFFFVTFSNSGDIKIKKKPLQSKHIIEHLYYLDLACTSWEDNQLGLVGFQPLHISLQTFQGMVLAAMIDSNANSWSKFFGNTSRLQYKKYIIKKDEVKAEFLML